MYHVQLIILLILLERTIIKIIFYGTFEYFISSRILISKSVISLKKTLLLIVLQINLLIYFY